MGAPPMLCALLLLLCSTTPAADWPTYRGNPQRTGNLDDKPGPKTPFINWVYKAPKHFVASPVVAGDALFVSGLGAFNTASLHALSLAPDAKEREIWSRTAPAIKLPSVASPAVVGDLVIVGDGMHQTDGATLYCFSRTTGRTLWQFTVPGHLVHMESAPTVHEGRAYVGAGDAGVFCVDIHRVTVDGKEMDAAAAGEILRKKWAELQANFEKEKARDPQFAIPPTEDDLPKVTPKIVWQKGKGEVHVDAPLALHAGRLYVASAFIEEDKAGKRALLCLDAKDGSTIWETPLNMNPWGGATIAKDAILVGCSTIRMDRKLIPQAKGEVVALDPATGKIKWTKTPGGVLAPVATKGDLLAYASTDGTVVCRDLASATRKWTYTAPGNTPFFAGVAIAGDAENAVVYAADLKGVVHAINLTDGQAQWTFDVPNDPAVKQGGGGGAIFGSPIVHAGRVYVATCNLDSAEANVPCVVAAIANEPGQSLFATKPVTIDKANRRVIVPAAVAPRKLATLKDVYPLEVVATKPAPYGQKAHETVVTIDSHPRDVHKALESLGLKPGAPAKGESASASGPLLRIYLQYAAPGLRPRKLPIERTMLDRRTGKPMPPLQWRFTGSALRQTDPNDPTALAYGADLSGTLISLFPVTDETVIQSTLTMGEEQFLRLETDKDILPAEGTPVELVIEAAE